MIKRVKNWAFWVKSGKFHALNFIKPLDGSFCFVLGNAFALVLVTVAHVLG